MPNKRVLYVQYTNPAEYPPIAHGSRILAERGWKVFFWGTHSCLETKLEFEPHPNIRVRKMRFCPPGFKQKLHYLFFGLGFFLQMLVLRPRWVYVSDVLATPWGVLASYWPGVNVIYHEHDSPEKTEAEMSSFMRRLMRCRARLGQRATACVLPGEQRKARFLEAVDVSVETLCVWNCPEREAIAALETTQKISGLQLVYQGSIVPNRLPLALLDAMADLPEELELSIVGYPTVGFEGYIESYLEKAESLGLKHRVHYQGTFQRQEMLDFLTQRHIGLSLFETQTTDQNEQSMVGPSNKPFEYLGCGMALLVPELPLWQTTFVEPGFGVACTPSDAASIKKALKPFLDHPERCEQMGQSGRKQILEHWNYQQQFVPVVTLMESS